MCAQAMGACARTKRRTQSSRHSRKTGKGKNVDRKRSNGSRGGDPRQSWKDCSLRSDQVKNLKRQPKLIALSADATRQQASPSCGTSRTFMPTDPYSRDDKADIGAAAANSHFVPRSRPSCIARRMAGVSPEHRDEAAATAFFAKAIGNNSRPDKVVICQELFFLLRRAVNKWLVFLTYDPIELFAAAEGRLPC